MAVAYHVKLTNRARKQYKALDPAIQSRIRGALVKLADDPTPAAAKALWGSDNRTAVGQGLWHTWRPLRPATGRPLLASEDPAGAAGRLIPAHGRIFCVLNTSEAGIACLEATAS